MKLSGFIILIIIILPISLAAQEGSRKVAVADSSRLILNQLETGPKTGNIKVKQDPRLTSILRKHAEFNKTASTPGFRILVYKGRDMSKANQMKAEFEESFSQLELKVTIEYNEPDFSTLVGAFRTKADAYRYRQILIVRFPNAYLVPARITLD